MERFSVQRTADGFVVVDLASAACTPDDLEEGAAESLAAELNSRIAAGHTIDAVRWVLPQQVRAAAWRPAGAIDVWVYDKNSTQWVARVTDGSGWVEWCPGSDLRPDPAGDKQRQRGAAAQTERMAG